MIKQDPWAVAKPQNWDDATPAELPEGATGVRALRRQGAPKNNVLQLSISWNVTEKRLNYHLNTMELAGGLVLRRDGEIKDKSTADIPIGRYSRIVFEAKGLAHGEVWVVTDDVHVFVATYTCEKKPSSDELKEVAEIVKSVRWRKL